VRTSREGKVLLVFVARSSDFPQESKIIPVLMREFPSLVGIHQNVNPARTNVILGRKWRRIYGQDYLEERLGRLTFRLSPSAFFQVNSPQAEVLYDSVKAMAGSGERLLDLYTGVGTIALWLSDRFREVGGVEEIRQRLKTPKPTRRSTVSPTRGLSPSPPRRFWAGFHGIPATG